jgi:formate dehydrogenase subunit gamma
MSTEAIPASPAPLSADEAEAMLQRRLKKHDVAIVLLHWFNAATWVLLVATGAALVVSPYFRIAPEWYTTLVESIFGGRASLLTFHIALGLTWIGVFLVYGIFGFRSYLHHEVLRKEIALDRDDWRWLLVRTLGILGRSTEELPPQGSYNAGQKLFGLAVYSMVPVIMLTGLVMTFGWPSPAAVGWAVVLHFTAVGLVVSGLMIHVYMAAVFPEEKPAFFSMITGSVHELYAYSHHFKWWREEKAKQLARRAHRDAALAAAASAPAPDATGPKEAPPPATPTA